MSCWGPIFAPILPPPTDRRLHAAYLVGVPASGDTGERAFEGGPAAVIVVHSMTDDGDGRRSPVDEFPANFLVFF